MPKSPLFGKHAKCVGMHKLVLDTNVVVSACISDFAPPARIVDELFLQDKIALCVSQEVLAEYIEVLNRDKFLKIRGFTANAQKFLRYVAEFGHWFEPEISFMDATDADDNIFLDLAFCAASDFIISGNLKHFPSPDFKGIPIVSPSDYWRKFGQ